jgi:hypothetical protein
MSISIIFLLVSDVADLTEVLGSFLAVIQSGAELQTVTFPCKFVFLNGRIE